MKKSIKSLFAVLLLVAGMSFVFTACSDDDDDVKVPDIFTTALKQHYPDVKNVEWEKKGVYRVADFQKEGIDYDIWFDNEAKLVMTELDYGENINGIPDTEVASAFLNGEYGSWIIDDVKYYKQITNEFYLIEVEQPSQPDMELYYNMSGELIKAVRSDTAPDILPETVI